MTAMTRPLCGKDWDHLLAEEFEKEYWDCLTRSVEQERDCFHVYPARDKVFEALRLTPCSKTKVVIVGQDPYQREGLAHGLAFSVPRSAEKRRLPPSLRNIFRSLREDPDLPPEVRATDPDHGNLEAWAGRGVLLLNTTLTVREGVPGSHQGMGWETFTNRVIEEVERARPVFMLWGEKAKKKRALLLNTPEQMIIESPHPRTAAFPKSQPFSRANRALKESFDWTLPD
jgi:uracil-DNA glycosylase